MTALRTAAQQALEALDKLWQIIDDIDTYGDMAKADDKLYRSLVERKQRTRFEETGISTDGYTLNGGAITALRAALAQQDEPQTLNDAMQQPRAMAQTYENGYKAGVAHEREACAQVCEARFMGDMTREDMEARRCAAAIRARGVQP